MQQSSPKRPIDRYYNRFDPAKNYETILYRDGYGVQASDWNEWQDMVHHRLGGIGNALFKDGDIIRDAQIAVNVTTGAVRASAGAVYLDGAVRQVAANAFTISIDGSIAVGIRLIENTISELEDPSLYNPAVGTGTHGQAGSWRKQIIPNWGFEGDGAEGKFYVVHVVDDGIVRHKEAPPNLDSFNQGIAKYDRDSTGGGQYIVNGLVVRTAEGNDNAQVYTVSEGRARVHGYGIELPTSRRLAYDAMPDVRPINMEPHLATGEATQRINVAQAPIRDIISVGVTRERTVAIVHGAYLGVSDTLPNTSVVSIIKCQQGETIYQALDDYSKTGDTVNWSAAGAEPAPGSTYDCTYTYMENVEAEALDFDGFTISDAVAGSHIIIDYNQALPRLDRLCLTQEGTFIWRKGIASASNPKLPNVPDDMLPIATIYQTWRQQALVQNDGIRVTSFAEIESQNARIDYALREIARNRLEGDAVARESGARVGIFVDSFIDDANRDQGIEQSAAIVNGCLTLSITAHVKALAMPLTLPETLSYTPSVVLSQPLRTGEMAINPYMAFGVLPASVAITPAIDQWTEKQSNFTSAITHHFNTGHIVQGVSWIGNQSQTSTTQVVSNTTQELEFLREINIAFTLDGFGVGERLENISFDGIDVSFSPTEIIADASGVASGSFTIPPKIPAGAKTVTFTGTATTGAAVFVGQGNLNVQTLRQINTITTLWIDPLAQTFTLESNTQICGVDIWFTDKAENAEVRVQIREVQNGVPTRTVLAEAILQADSIVTSGGGHTRVDFPVLVSLLANSEYALVVLCNDPTTALAVAEMGKFDSHAQKWVAAQPYTVGVLLSSSNASTWTAHQSHDLAFRLLEASFTSDTRTIDMGSVELLGSTDLVMLALDETPTADTHVEYEITFNTDSSSPDAKTVLYVAQGQAARLPAPMTGAVGVCAKLKGTNKAAPLLWPNAQLLTGTVSEADYYYARSVTATNATKATIIYDAFIPSGATVTPEIQLDGGDWQGVTAGATVNQGDGVVEFTFNAVLENVDLLKLRLLLTGTSVARPFVANLRIMAIK